MTDTVPAIVKPEPPAGAEVLHLRRFSVHDVEERWRRGNLIGQRCTGCTSPKVAMQIVVFIPVDEFVRRSPEAAEIMRLGNDGVLPTAQLLDGTTLRDYLIISKTCACDNCAPTLERVAARDVPSWCVVEIRRAPKHKIVVPMSGRGRRRGRA